MNGYKHTISKSVMYIELRCDNVEAYDRIVEHLEDIANTDNKLEIDTNYTTLKKSNRRVMNISERQEDGD